MACGCSKKKTAAVTPAEQQAAAQAEEAQRLDAARRIEIARRAAQRATQNA